MRLETVSRAFSRLKRLELIEASDIEVTLLDLPGLASLAGSDDRP
jgi:hypothetical protein